MKTVAFILMSILSFGFNGFSQTEDNHLEKTDKKQIIVMVGTASWCHVCAANGPRVKENVLSKYMNHEKVRIVINDLSSEESKAKSKENCAKEGISEVAQQYNATGMIYFIDPTTKKVISEISVVKSNEEITKTFEEIISKI